jgi:hypothetical protein
MSLSSISILNVPEDPIRIPYLAEIHQIILSITNISFHELDIITKMQIIMDSTKLSTDSIWTQKQNRNLAIENRIESLLDIYIFKNLIKGSFNPDFIVII